MAYLANEAAVKEQEGRDPRGCYRCEDGPGGVSRWNAFLARTSGLTLLFSAGLLLGCFFAVLLRVRTFRLSTLHPSRLTLALSTCGSVGVLLSSAILYATYKPYGGTFQRYLQTGDEREIRDFINFLDQAQFFPLELKDYWVGEIAVSDRALFRGHSVPC
jgi:hypothetical protein